MKESPVPFYLHSVGMGKDPGTAVQGLSHVVRREPPLPVLRAILGVAQLTPGPRELPVSGRGVKSFTAAAPFLLLLPSVLAKQRNRDSGKVGSKEKNQRIPFRMRITSRKNQNFPAKGEPHRDDVFTPDCPVMVWDKLHRGLSKSVQIKYQAAESKSNNPSNEFNSHLVTTNEN